MPDNTPVRDGNQFLVQAATDELADGSQSPKVTLLPGDGTTVGISPATTNLQQAHSTLFGATSETAPGTDTAASGLNGRLQRLAQRMTSLIALVGEVQVTPTVNTVLDRLKAIKDSVDNGVVSTGSIASPSPDVLTTNNVRVAAATLGSLASAATSAQLLAANASRVGLIVSNTDANDLILKYGTTASATSYTVRIPSNGYWEMPMPIYTGRIDAIWAADGSGFAYYTEL